jgi:PAS domain S-box-containing protein
MHHAKVSATADFEKRASSLRDLRLWLLISSLMALFLLDIRLPEVALLPFMVVPVVAAATFASARATAGLAVLALALGVISGVVNGDFANDDYWIRLAGVGLVAGLAVYLAQRATLRERRLRDGERRLQLMLDNTADAVFLLDGKGCIAWASPAAQAQLGIPPDELVGRERIELVHFEDRRGVEAHLRQAANGEQVCSEERVRTSTGEYRWMSVASRPVSGEGAPKGWHVAALRDVHEDVMLRDALARSERMFRMAMDGAAQGMAVVGLHQRFFEVNAALCALVGRDALWLSDHDEDELIHPDELEPTRQLRDRLLAGLAEHETRTSRLVTAHGSTVWVEHAVGLLRDEHGLPLFFVCQYNDLGGFGLAQSPGYLEDREAVASV